MDINKKEFVEDIRDFVRYLTFIGIKAASIARAAKLKSSSTIRSLKFGYETAVKIKFSYINNYKIYKKEKNEKE